MHVRSYADLPGVISVSSRFLPLTAFRELLFGPALSLSRRVSPLVLTGSFPSSHTTPGCSSEAPSQYAATVSPQKLQHGSSCLISSPRRAVLRLPASLLMILCQVPTAHRQTRFNRVVDRGRVRSKPALQLYGSFCRGSLYVEHTSLMRRRGFFPPARPFHGPEMLFSTDSHRTRSLERRAHS